MSLKMRSKRLVLWLCVGLSFIGLPGLGGARGWAQSPATEPSPHGSDLLGAPFVSKSYGLEFRPPANSTEIDKPNPDTIVEFDRTQDGVDFQLKVWRYRTMDRAVPLTVHKNQFGQPQDGVLEETVANIKNSTPGAEILRNEVMNVGRLNVGMIGVRYINANQQRRFTQQAIFEAPNAGQHLYYFLQLSGPGKPASEPNNIENPAERLAYQTFAQVVDSVVLLDRKDVYQDQIDRLDRTRALFVTWAGARYKDIRGALVTQQYQRIIRDGKDVGYSYIVEEFEEKPKSVDESMIRVGVRTRLIPQLGKQWDTECWMTSTIDRKHEVWRSMARCINPKNEVIDNFTQLGASDEREKAVILQAPQGAGGLGPVQGAQGNLDLQTVRQLQVTTEHSQGASGPAGQGASAGAMQMPAFVQETPPFFLPQAFSYLLPRLLPMNRATTYMFATFVAATPDEFAQGKIVARYLDVKPLKQVTFNDQQVQAIEVDDRIGLDGEVTKNYFSSDFKFIGSIRNFTHDGKTVTEMILPSDVSALERLWSRPDLSRPQEIPTGAAGGPALPRTPSADPGSAVPSSPRTAPGSGTPPGALPR